jgi:hypothetical protein
LAQSAAPSAIVRVTQDRVPQLQEAMRILADSIVLVGIPMGAAARPPPDTVGNAELLYLHEHGVPGKFPARASLNPGVRNSEARWRAPMLAAANAALDANPGEVQRHLHIAGQVAVAAVKNGIAAGIPPPLAPYTIMKRRQRSKGSSYRRKAKHARDTTPLIDTGNLIGAITYVVASRRRRARTP